ncbi:hypothetical protein GCM10022223_21920 [Kineosporia mesophila]|uniref:Uncharacterized protein n=1 Tax=Kineosporia mesophila TaxID=566012 RepID=A0ABP6ZDD8_9ACTN|nr:hypothetical protein [Kineosporia mesophila]MCD5350280.1 hypothetical protein [Kineosporia mesophila]
MKSLRFLAGTVVAGAALALLGPIAPAQAASSCTITPTSATLFTKAKNVKFGVAGSTEWTVEISDLFVFAVKDPDFSSTIVQMSPKFYLNSDAGLHAVKVTRATSECSTSFRLLRGSVISAKATNIGSGKRTVTGTLKRADFGYGTYSAVSGQKVRIEYKTATGKWAGAGTVTTAKNGTFKLTKKSAKRQWRAVFGGTSTTATRTSAVTAG